MNVLIPQNWTLSCFKKKSPLLTESKYEYNQNYIQCFAFVCNKPKLYAVLGFGESDKYIEQACSMWHEAIFTNRIEGSFNTKC